MEEKEIRYQILEECKCGPEEFFILVSSVENKDLDLFLKTLVILVWEGLLKCDRGHETNIPLSIEEIQSYVQKRIEAGESLDEYPTCCTEYKFTTTEKGLVQLKEEDKPIHI